jgi:hypothetical protein
MLQDKQAEEEEQRRGHWGWLYGPGKGAARWGIERWPRRRRGADPECCSGVGAAWARTQHAVERGHVAQRPPISRPAFEASPNLEFTARASMFGKVCLRHSLRFRRASARHIKGSPGIQDGSRHLKLTDGWAG